MVAAISSQASRRSGIVPERAIADGGQPGRDETEPVGPEVDEQREQRPDVEHDAERQRLDERVVPAEQERDDDQVPGRGDRQELGESLHDPHDQRLDHGIHHLGAAPDGRCPRCRLRALAHAPRGALAHVLTGALASASSSLRRSPFDGRHLACVAAWRLGAGYRMNSGASTRVIVASSLTRTWSDGPAVSLNGSPTVSPTTAAACAAGLLADHVAVLVRAGGPTRCTSWRCPRRRRRC